MCVSHAGSRNETDGTTKQSLAARVPGLLPDYSSKVALCLSGQRMIYSPASRGEVRLFAIRRAAVDFDTPHASAAARTEPPGTTIVLGALRGRPSRVPSARA